MRGCQCMPSCHPHLQSLHKKLNDNARNERKLLTELYQTSSMSLLILNRVPALTGWDKGENVTSARWQVTLCDPVWHVSYRSGEASCITA